MQVTSSHSSIVKKTIPIVYEDEAICIVDKPYGVPVQGGARVRMSLIAMLEAQLGCALFPVHRLDKETAGLLITAKTSRAAQDCRLLFDSQRIEKEYGALCFGECRKASSGTIDTPIRENGILKPALSTYRVIARDNGYTLFSVKLHTGRMHQIRIHLAHMGNPIIGDDKHGNFALNKALWKSERIKKLQLCACRLGMPIDHRIRTFAIEYPRHMQEALTELITAGKAGNLSEMC